MISKNIGCPITSVIQPEILGTIKITIFTSFCFEVGEGKVFLRRKREEKHTRVVMFSNVLTVNYIYIEGKK
jgi:hypothetical protein